MFVSVACLELGYRSHDSEQAVAFLARTETSAFATAARH